jgi:hypothetical protein
MTARLFATLTSFVGNVRNALPALPVPGPNHINDPNYCRFNYGFWTNHYPQSPGYTVNYKENIQTALVAQMGFQGGRVWRGGTVAGLLANDQYWLELIRDNLDAPGVYQPMSPPVSVVVVGKRQNNIWRFYYQECEALIFRISRERRGRRTSLTNPAYYQAVTIMNHGQLWPEPSRSIFRIDG